MFDVFIVTTSCKARPERNTAHHVVGYFSIPYVQIVDSSRAVPIRYLFAFGVVCCWPKGRILTNSLCAAKPGKRSRKQTEEEAVPQPGEAETSSEEELEEEPSLLDERWARARGLSGPMDSGSSEDEDSSENSEEDISDDVQGSDEEVCVLSIHWSAASLCS